MKQSLPDLDLVIFGSIDCISSSHQIILVIRVINMTTGLNGCSDWSCVVRRVANMYVHCAMRIPTCTVTLLYPRLESRQLVFRLFVCDNSYTDIYTDFIPWLLFKDMY